MSAKDDNSCVFVFFREVDVEGPCLAETRQISMITECWCSTSPSLKYQRAVGRSLGDDTTSVSLLLHSIIPAVPFTSLMMDPGNH